MPQLAWGVRGCRAIALWCGPLAEPNGRDPRSHPRGVHQSPMAGLSRGCHSAVAGAAPQWGAHRQTAGGPIILYSCRSGALLLAAAALIAVPESASSQAREPEWASLRLPGDTLVSALPTPQAIEQPCPDCNPPKRFWAGVGELMVAQAIPWAFTKYVTEGEWSNISFRTWSDNLKFPWQWDNNKFNNNQFAHPYHGSLYYNAGRANGYNFWESMPWAFGGSLMWELFGEVWAPAPNDLANTTLGGSHWARCCSGSPPSPSTTRRPARTGWCAR